MHGPPLGRPLSICPEKRDPEDGQRRLCLTFLNNSGRSLEGKLGFSEACRAQAKGKLTLPEGDSRPSFPATRCLWKAGQGPSDLAFKEKLESQALHKIFWLFF